MKLLFRWVQEDQPGTRWLQLFERAWPSYRAWFLREGSQARPSLAKSRQEIEAFMPELLPMWTHLAELSGEGEMAARMLSLYRPTAFLAGCSQVVWTQDEPMLVRNYDYDPAACEGTSLLSSWNGTRVLATSDCLWGALDGMNEHGLAVALSFGGAKELGDGFGIPLIVRYVLETCRSVDDAVAVLRRVPSHMVYNVSLLDASGEYAVASLGPGRETRVERRAVATNHQGEGAWTEYEEATHSRERERFLEDRLRDPHLTREGLRDLFLEPPLHVREYARGIGTLYTVAYYPRTLRAEFLWRGAMQAQSLDGLVEKTMVIPLHP